MRFGSAAVDGFHLGEQHLSEVTIMFEDFLTGAVFGAALRASGVYEPAIITSQLNATNWHMVQTFLTGSGTSVCVSPALPFPSWCRQTEEGSCC